MRLTPDDSDSGACAISRMAAVHPLEYSIVQRLDPHADTRNPQIQQAPDVPLAPLDNVLGVDFNREFGVGMAFADGLKCS